MRENRIADRRRLLGSRRRAFLGALSRVYLLCGEAYDRRLMGRCVILAVAGAALVLTGSGAPRGIKEGGTFRIAVAGVIDSIDPAIPNLAAMQPLLEPACATLMAYSGARLAPSLAVAEPAVSRDGKTYTFTIRKDARFSNGSRVTAHAFAHALERIFTPAMESPPGIIEVFEDIVGARKLLGGKTTSLAGAVATGMRLTLKLKKPARDFLEGLTLLCAVPPNLPADPEGANVPLPSPAPYYVADYVPGERLLLERNRFYRGERPHHVDRFVAELASDYGPGIDQVESGAADVLWPRPTPEQTVELAKRYGINKSQLFVKPANALRMFSLNPSQPLFRDNVKLRQAINYAVDRQALVREAGPQVETPTDQYLTPSMPGYRDERIYPLKGPNLAKAQKLAKGRTRGGRAVLYTIDSPSEAARAEIVKENLAKIGLEVDVKLFPTQLFFQKIGTPGEPFDLARIQFVQTTGVTRYLNGIFDGVLPSRYARLLGRASRLAGDERYRTYGDLDVQISRDVAPMIPVAAVNWQTFVSARVGCIVFNPFLNLTAVCLK